MFGFGQRHGSRQVTGRGTGLEVDTFPDAAPVQLLILQHVITVANPLCVHLVNRLRAYRAGVNGLRSTELRSMTCGLTELGSMA